jgi:hypothetical protein
VAELLKYEVDIEAHDDNGMTGLACAAAEGAVDALLAMYPFERDTVDNNGTTAVAHACVPTFSARCRLKVVPMPSPRILNVLSPPLASRP